MSVKVQWLLPRQQEKGVTRDSSKGHDENAKEEDGMLELVTRIFNWRLSNVIGDENLLLSKRTHFEMCDEVGIIVRIPFKFFTGIGFQAPLCNFMRFTAAITEAILEYEFARYF